MTRKIYVLKGGYFDVKKKGRWICAVWNVRVGGLSGCYCVGRPRHMPHVILAPLAVKTL